MYEIRPITENEMEDIRIARNAQIDVLRQKKEISKEEQKRYFHEVIAPNLNKKDPDMILFSIFKNKEWIGYGGLVHIDWDHKRAEVSFLLKLERTKNLKEYREDFLNFLKLLSDKAFNEYRLNRLHTETYAFREEIIKILEDFGFKKEGVLKGHIQLHGKPIDSVLHGLLKNDIVLSKLFK